MKRHKIEKQMRDEALISCDNVFARLSDQLDLPTFKRKLPWWKQLKFSLPVSLAFSFSLVAGIIVISQGKPSPSIDIAHISLAVANNQNNENLALFSYSIDENNAAMDFLARNDGAKIVASGIDLNDMSNGVTLTNEIIEESKNTGYLNNMGSENVIRLSVFSVNRKESLTQDLKNSIIEYCKNNYIYAQIEEKIIEVEEVQGMEESKYEKIYKIFQLAKIFRWDNTSSQENVDDFVAPYFPSNDISYWLETFKDVDDSKLDTAISKLEMINQALSSDKAKNQFKNELKRVLHKYLNGIQNLNHILNELENEIDCIIDHLFKKYNYQYGEVELKEKTSTSINSVLDAWEWLFEINSMDQFMEDLEQENFDYYYDYEHEDPFHDSFSYDYYEEWEFEDEWGNNHHNPRMKGPGSRDKDYYINRVEHLVKDYNHIIDCFPIYYEQYQNNKKQILANVYFRASDETNSEYYINYEEQYNELKGHHGHGHGHEWENWKEQYDDDWWNK